MARASHPASANVSIPCWAIRACIKAWTLLCPPVMAAGSGDISFMGWANGYGNFVVLSHGNGYSTAYGHLSRFAPGMRKGGRVRQGQVFAYSGATGLATGPHLHYEIRVNNEQVNPLTVKVAEGRLLSGPELRTFLDQRLKMDTTIAA